MNRWDINPSKPLWSDLDVSHPGLTGSETGRDGTGLKNFVNPFETAGDAKIISRSFKP